MTVRLFYTLKLNLNSEEAALFDGFSKFTEIGGVMEIVSADYENVTSCIDHVLEFFERKMKFFNDSLSQDVYQIIGVQHQKEDNAEEVLVEKIVTFLLVNDDHPAGWIMKASIMADKTPTEYQPTHYAKTAYLH